MATDDSTEYDRWESRYRVPEYAFGTAPNYFLATCKALLPRAGKALAVADGEGRNGIWLAEQGLDVLSIDFSPSATASALPERGRKWAGMRRALKPGGLLIIQGYTPKQLQYGTGGPKQVETLYTRAMLEDAFGDLRDLTIVEEEREIHEGTSHGGMSAMINLTARR